MLALETPGIGNLANALFGAVVTHPLIFQPVEKFELTAVFHLFGKAPGNHQPVVAIPVNDFLDPGLGIAEIVDHSLCVSAPDKFSIDP